MLLCVLACVAHLSWNEAARPETSQKTSRETSQETSVKLDIVDRSAAFSGLEAVLIQHGWTRSLAGEDENSSLAPHDSILNSVHTICESGMDTGHTALHVLLNAPGVTLVSFSSGLRKFSRPAAEYLQGLFPGRLSVTWGEDNKTMASFRNATPKIKCDLIIIGGYHKYDLAKASLLNSATLLASNNTTVLQIGCPLYDAPFSGVYEAWSELAASGCVFTSPSNYHYEGLSKGVCKGVFNVEQTSPCRMAGTPRRVIEIYIDPARFFSDKSTTIMPDWLYDNPLYGRFASEQFARDAFLVFKKKWDIRIFPYGNSSWPTGYAEPTYGGANLTINGRFSNSPKIYAAEDYNRLEACALEHIPDAIVFIINAHKWKYAVFDYSEGQFESHRMVEECLVPDDLEKGGRAYNNMFASDRQMVDTMMACIGSLSGNEIMSGQGELKASIGQAASQFYVYRAASVNAAPTVNGPRMQDSMKVFVDGYEANFMEISAEMALEDAICGNVLCSLMHFINLLEELEVTDSKEMWRQVKRDEEIQLQRKAESRLERLRQQQSKSSTKSFLSTLLTGWVY